MQLLWRLVAPAIALALPCAASAETVAELIKRMEGVYKERFTNGMVVPGKPDAYFKDENIVEVVGYGVARIYVRAELHFYNGHTCSIAGIATHDNGRFVYRDPEKAVDGGPSCQLTVTQSEDALTITDRLGPDGAATCKAYCGVRGSLSHVSMPSKVRRPIRYLPRIIQSRQYQKAVGELKPDERMPSPSQQ